MALKPCRECNKKVSTEASVCPLCGVPNPTKANKRQESSSKIKKMGYSLTLEHLMVLI